MTNYIQHVLESTPLIYVLLEYDGTINYVSPGLQKVLGLNPDEVLQQNWFQLTRRDAVQLDNIKLKINQFTASSETILSNYVEQMNDAFGKEVYILWNTIKTPDSKLWKWINLISMILILIVFLLLVLKVWYDSKLIASQLLPNYTVIYTNGALINITCFLMGGFIPALFLRIKQQYLISTMCILVFFIVGFVLKNSINIYENFYGLSQYLG